MLSAEADRAGEFGFPGGERLVRAGIDQVEADPRKGTLGGVERGEPFGDIMRAPQKFQRRVVERLQAERHPVHAGGGQIGKARGFDRGRVGLKRDFDIAREAPGRFGGAEHRRDRFGRHQRGRAAAEENRAELSAGRLGCFMREVSKQALAPGGLIDAVADMAVEVAIGAFRHAERPMDIKRERRRLGIMHARPI